LKDFTHTNRQVRFDAVTAVLFIGGDPKALVPALQSLLKDPMYEIRGNAAVALGNFGGRARAAVPALLGAMEDLARSGDDTQKGLVEYALWHIAPETVGKPLVVEETTPMLAKGATTEALDVLFNGERRTILPPGRPVPCVVQFWNQEPRGSLTLYRSASRPTKAEHCLGEYEVVGIPSPPASVNVSLLCVIANRQIILCARDNNRPGFLEVRRVK
jgi:HEAT repeats